MKVKNVAVIGLESSGTHMVQKRLADHRELRIWGDSVPTGRGGIMHQPVIPDETDVLIVVTRDQNCRQASADRLYNRENWPHADMQNYLISLLAEFKGQIIWVSYEAIIGWGQPYWDWIHKQMGISWCAVNNRETFDGNKKYIKDEQG